MAIFESGANENTGSAEEKRHWRWKRRRVCRVQRRAWRRWWRKGRMRLGRSKSGAQKRLMLVGCIRLKLDV